MLTVNVYRLSVSIHASVKDATPAPGTACQTGCSFNPRVREGRDVDEVMLGGYPQVSIHASVKDATYRGKIYP